MKKNLLEQIIFEKKIELAREYMELKEIENLLKEEVETKDERKARRKKLLNAIGTTLLAGGVVTPLISAYFKLRNIDDNLNYIKNSANKIDDSTRNIDRNTNPGLRL